MQVTFAAVPRERRIPAPGETSASRRRAHHQATNRALRGGDAEKPFRRDPFYRLNEIEIRLLSLRASVEDIVPLARHFLSFYGGATARWLSHDAEALVRDVRLAGQRRARERRQARRRAARRRGHRGRGRSAAVPLGRPRAQAPEWADRSSLGATRSSRHGGSRTATRAGSPKLLGVRRKTLYARLKRFQLTL